MLRTLLSRILSDQDEFRVETAADGREALTAARERRPDVLLLDLSLPALSGAEVLDHLSEDAERPRVLVLSGDESQETQLAAARRGASGFLGKSSALPVLADAIRTVAEGKVWLAPEVVGRLVSDYAALARRTERLQSPVSQLSPRELAVLVRVARGLTNQQIASGLSMSISTVKTHLNSIFRKLDLPSRTEAAVFAVREGLLEEDAGR